MLSDIHKDAKGHRATWRVSLEPRDFRAVVVQPQDEHCAAGALLKTAIDRLLTGPISEADTYTVPDPPRLMTTRFDLIVFPEAFLPISGLPEVLSMVKDVPHGAGLLHFGLRPNATNHLFSTAVALEFLTDLEGKSELLVIDEIAVLKNWIRGQPEGRWNLAALVGRCPEEEKVYVCVHAKIVRSKYEQTVGIETTMSESKLLFLIDLVSHDQPGRTITLQPLICSDLTGAPSWSGDLNCFQLLSRSWELATHAVQVVSAPTATPVASDGSGLWKSAFLDLILGAMSDTNTLHCRCCFVLSNYKSYKKRLFGRSGFVVPGRPTSETYGGTKDFVHCRPPGKKREKRPEFTGGREEAWILADEKYLKKKWPTTGWLSVLDSSDAGNTMLAASLCIPYEGATDINPAAFAFEAIDLNGEVDNAFK